MDVRTKVGKPRDHRSIDPGAGAGDWDANVGSRAKCLSIQTQGRAETNEGSRRWRGLFRDVVIALVNQES